MEATAQNTQEPQQQETKWYVLRVVSGKEKKVKEYLDKEITRGGWSGVVKQVFLPVEKVYKVQNGKKVVRERNYYPGYVMIEIAEGKLSDDLRDVIKNTTNVIHFLGKENPIALRKAEVNKLLGKMDEMAEAGGVSMSEPFIVGETIKIIEGPFNDLDRFTNNEWFAHTYSTSFCHFIHFAKQFVYLGFAQRNRVLFSKKMNNVGCIFNYITKI